MFVFWDTALWCSFKSLCLNEDGSSKMLEVDLCDFSSLFPRFKWSSSFGRINPQFTIDKQHNSRGNVLMSLLHLLVIVLLLTKAFLRCALTGNKSHDKREGGAFAEVNKLCCRKLSQHFWIWFVSSVWQETSPTASCIYAHSIVPLTLVRLLFGSISDYLETRNCRK